MNTPDDLVGWLPFALQGGKRLIGQHSLAAIVASAPPFTTAVAGCLLRLLTSRPLLIDMRDAWVEDQSDPFGTIGGHFRAPHGAIRRLVLRALERLVLGAADGILYTSTYTMRQYLARYPQTAARSELVLNGAEEADFSRDTASMPAFTFAYVGSLHDYQLPDMQRFLGAFALALDRDPSFGSARVYLAGHCGRALTERLRQIISQHSLTGSVTIAGPIPHDRAIDILKGAGVILLLAGSNPFVRLTKVSEAAAARRPVLVFASPGSETARCAAELGQTVCSGQSIEELSALLLRLSHAEPAGVEATFPFPYPHPAHWRTAAEQVARRLDRLTTGSR